MGSILGKVALGELDAARGPDVSHSIRVPTAWLTTGETIEVELPRNLTCARCDGGGCDLCERAGALTLRERQTQAESVQVSLPGRGGQEAMQTGTSILIRIPDHGGLAREPDRPRGLLLLKVTAASEADSSVRLVDRVLAEREFRAPPELVVRSLVIAVALLVLFALMLRLSGWL